MTLSQILIAHAAAAIIVSFLVVAAILVDAGQSYFSATILGIFFPFVFLVVYITSVVPVVRRWARKNGWNAYWQAALAGAVLGAALYFCLTWLINGRELATDPSLALTVLASGIGMGIVGGLIFLATERRLHKREIER